MSGAGGDAWVLGPDGDKYWGRFGAAGLLVHDRGRGVLLQHRAVWSHHGDTWGLPGGARHAGESATEGAVREAHEEAGVPVDRIAVRSSSTLDLGFWSYTTVVAETVLPFEPVISDPESIELRWVPVTEVESLPLHPGFAASWPILRRRLGGEFGLGLAALGRPDYINLGHGGDFVDGASVVELRGRTHGMLDAAWAGGIRYIDAARSYGLAERFLGEWIALHPERRAQLTIGSKWGYEYVADWRRDATVHEIKNHSLAAFSRQWPETLEALGTAPDIYLVHSLTEESGALDDAALLERLAELAASGVRVGLSTSGPGQARVLEQVLALGDAAPFSAVQTTWNLLEQSAGEALKAAHASGWTVVVKEGVANGRLTERGLADGSLPELAEAAERSGRSPDTIALSAVRHQLWADVVLSGATTAAQLASNLSTVPTPQDDLLARMRERSESYWAERSALSWN
ncbi:aldo/keto reductase [Luethyella okanaganae]|uniref:Aldo/keto reductase n=1 Tax=Luethyella okanaganae TaxID=69372 RepID=A0ABW1VGV3_9MICO